MGKKFEAAVKLVEKPAYTLADAMPLVKKAAFAKFDETVEVAIRLGVDPKHADQMVRGTVVLPHGTGKSVKVLVIAQGDKVREAEAAGADRTKSDAEAIYRLLEEKIIPLYYQRSDDEVPHDFIQVMKAAMRSVAPAFSTRRMAKEYAERFYIAALRPPEK